MSNQHLDMPKMQCCGEPIPSGVEYMGQREMVCCGEPIPVCPNAGTDFGACCGSPGALLNPAPTTAQERFDALYISSLQIGERLGVSRPAVMHARKSGKLPEPVCVNDGQIYIWERTEVEPYLAAWEMSVKLRRGEQVVIQRGPGNPFLQPVSDA